MKFQPKSETEIASSNILEAGYYPFTVSQAEDKISKSGNEMIELKLQVFSDKKGVRYVNDYLLEKLEFKLRHAADACGLLDKYELGELHAFDFIGKSGEVKIGIEKGENGYADKNKVLDYVVKAKAQGVGMSAQEFVNDEVPW